MPSCTMISLKFKSVCLFLILEEVAGLILGGGLVQWCMQVEGLWRCQREWGCDAHSSMSLVCALCEG